MLRVHEQLIPVFMLELLHFAIWFDFAGPLSISLLLVHLGLFLIWQPLWGGEDRLKWYDILILGLLVYAFINWMDWWLLFAWLILLIGISGGRILLNRRERDTNLLMLAFLVSELLIHVIPMLFIISIPANATEPFMIALPLLPLVSLLLPAGESGRRFQSVDIMHAIFVSALVTLLIVGTLLNMYLLHTDYLVALAQVLFVIGAFLFAISWLLTPRAGFSGLSQLWIRSILNIGTPFENWLSELSLLYNRKSHPEEFLSSAMRELIELPWIAGVEWSTGDSMHALGSRTDYETEFRADDMTICIFSYTPVSGALYFHCKLLIQLINILYTARLREKELTQQAHMQAVYETGARITHDIKNLLQSLQAITSVIVHDSNKDNYLVTRRLLRNQLPALTQRLQMALEKLQAPESSEPEPVYLKDWWQDLQTRINPENVQYRSDLSGDPVIPAELFDSIVDNLLENIRNKRQQEPDISTTITLFCDQSRIFLTICDSGSRIPDEKADRLFKDPLGSDSGLGIGLYQATRLAAAHAYTLILKHNQPGKVCFELSNEEQPGQINLI